MSMMLRFHRWPETSAFFSLVVLAFLSLLHPASGCYPGQVVEAIWPGPGVSGQEDVEVWLPVTVWDDLYDEDGTERLQIKWHFSNTVCETPGRKNFCKIEYTKIRPQGTLDGSTCWSELQVWRTEEAAKADPIIDPVSLVNPRNGPPEAVDAGDSSPAAAWIGLMIIGVGGSALIIGYFLWRWARDVAADQYDGSILGMLRGLVTAGDSEYFAQPHRRSLDQIQADLRKEHAERYAPRESFGTWLGNRPAIVPTTHPLSEFAQRYLPREQPPKRILSDEAQRKMRRDEHTKAYDERMRTLAKTCFVNTAVRGAPNFAFGGLRATPATSAAEHETKARLKGVGVYARPVIVRERGVHIPQADYYNTPEGRRMRQISVKRAYELPPPTRGSVEVAGGGDRGFGSPKSMRQTSAVAPSMVGRPGEPRGPPAIPEADEACFRPGLQTLVAGIGAKRYSRATRYGQRTNVVAPTMEAFLTSGPPGPAGM
ncbi:unnamed protein product [Amoebophrya sp. A25]|nr:unnamed protein product [Amoebophrya sp. A25]|eukprot:GSA25T00014148001.1